MDTFAKSQGACNNLDIAMSTSPIRQTFIYTNYPTQAVSLMQELGVTN